jgi:hypothetical protein
MISFRQAKQRLVPGHDFIKPQTGRKKHLSAEGMRRVSAKKEKIQSNFLIVFSSASHAVRFAQGFRGK